MAPSILGSLGAAIYYFTKAVTDYSLKKRMIEKGYVNEDTQAIFKQNMPTNGTYSSLKWGLIVLAAGLALVVLEFVDTHPDSPLPYGLFAVFVSTGFLVYYFVRKNQQNNP